MERIKLYINDTEVEAAAGQSVLQASLNAGIYIPHLCYHPDLPPQGGCKLCVVELDGDSDHPVTSCTAQVREGMRVVTRSDKLDSLRRTAMEFVLAAHPNDCTGCRSYGNCELQAMTQYLSATNARMRAIHRINQNLNIRNPLIDREMERCIQCGRCVRACCDMRGVGILDYRKKDSEIYIGTENDLPLADAGCRFCGACVEVCPTGALQDREGIFRKDIPREQALVPCQAECPAHIDIPGYIRLVGEGKHSEAVALIREKVPFPYVLGYVCNHLCEKGCKRGGLNEPIAIRDLKRYAVEHDTGEIWKQKSVHKSATGKKAAVIGSGPAGLTAAYYLAKLGHEVTVFERLPVAGGMMATGIPSYRLPREAVNAEIRVIQDAGVKIKTNCDIKSVNNLNGYDTVLVAVGAAAGKSVPLPGTEQGCTITAVEFLRCVSLGRKTPLVGPGRTVTVLGGGNVAFDAARISRRLGSMVNVVCLEAQGCMLADEEEIEQAEGEGIRIFPGKSSLSLESMNGRLTGLKVTDVSSFRFEEGRLSVQTVPGTDQLIPTDTVIFAAGQKTDLTDAFGLTLNRFGYPVYNRPGHSTDLPGVFVAGDVITGTKAVIDAIESGRRAASEMDRYLGGNGDISEDLTEKAMLNPCIGKVKGFADIPRSKAGVLGAEIRIESFQQVNLGLNDEQAHEESARCLQCDLRCQIKKNKLWNAYTDK